MTLNPTKMVNPSEESLALLASSSFAGPIAMLNLLSYDGERGKEEYGAYAQIAAQTIAAVGGSLMYLGQVIGSEMWDTLAVVYYPSPEGYLAMQNDQRYLDAIPKRTSGLSARLLYPFGLKPVSGADAADLTACQGTEIMAARLVRRNDSPAPETETNMALSSDATTALTAQAVGGGLVADERWDELVLLRYQSVEASAADAEYLSPIELGVSQVSVVLSQPLGQL